MVTKSRILELTVDVFKKKYDTRAFLNIEPKHSHLRIIHSFSMFAKGT